MPFDKHLFISYAHLDNEPPEGEQQGWITRFHRNLKVFLGQRLGRDAQIWRDERLRGDHIFGDEIVSQFPGTALLVSIVTPRYVQSEWCRKEVEAFCLAAERSGGLSVENKSRVVKIVKTPVPLTELPAVMRETIGYDFFVQKDSIVLEIDSAFGPEMVPLFNSKVAALAQSLADTLLKLENSKNGAGPKGPAKPLVYLAECGYDRRADRESIETDLRAHGYTVLPDRQLPIMEDDYVREVTSLMQRCSLGVHLVGSQYGMVPDGASGKSTPVLQHEVAMQLSRSAGLTRIISLPPGLTAKNAEQEKFISHLQNDADAQHGADLIIADLEAVKATVHTALKKLERPKVDPIPSNEPAVGEKLAYIICDQRDKEAMRPLRLFLKEAGYKARLPLFTDDVQVVRQTHENLLAECDLLVLFYGQGDVNWKATVEKDLFRLKAYRCARPMPIRCTLLAAPMTPDKAEIIEFIEPDTIDAIDAFPEESLRKLLRVRE